MNLLIHRLCDKNRLRNKNRGLIRGAAQGNSRQQWSHRKQSKRHDLKQGLNALCSESRDLLEHEKKPEEFHRNIFRQ